MTIEGDRDRFAFDDPCSEWIEASEAFKISVKRLGSSERAKRTLREALSGGTIRAVADALCIGFDFGPIPTAPPCEPKNVIPNIRYSRSGKPIVLTKTFFQRLELSRFNVEDSEWTTGVWHTVSASIGVLRVEADGQAYTPAARRILAFGVHVARVDLATVLNMSNALDRQLRSRAAISESSRPRLPVRQWRAALGDLYALAEKGRLEDKFGAMAYGTKAKIEKEIIRLLEAAGLSTSEATAKRKRAELVTMNEANKAIDSPY